MKRFLIHLLFIVTSIPMISCSKQQTICIHGRPGTEIYTPNMRKISVISNKGTTDITLSRKYTYNYLLSKEKNNDTYVPFVLDFKNRSVNLTDIGVGISYFMAIASGSAMLVGTVLGAAAEEQVGWIMAGIGGGLMFPFIRLGIYLDEMSWYDQYQYKFKYLPEQTTNQDIVFTPLKQTADYKTLDKSPQKASHTKANTERRKFNSGNTQSNKDPMSVITGTYSGNGELLDGSDVIEEYTDLSIVIKKKNENTVSVEVLASDGYSYFDEEMIYSITKQEGQYILKQKGSNSRIVIKNGNISYTNHNINDGDIVYTLKITANK